LAFDFDWWGLEFFDMRGLLSVVQATAVRRAWARPMRRMVMG
jgi:hypothetical protein